MNTYLYSGSFDPFTIGHAHVVSRLMAELQPQNAKLIICIGKNEEKTPFFTVEEKMEIIRLSLPEYQDSIEIISDDGLTVDIAIKHKASHLVRGIRSNSDDIAKEEALAMTNHYLALARGYHLDTKLITCSKETACISSTIVRKLLEREEYIAAFQYLKNPAHALVAEKMLSDFFTKHGFAPFNISNYMTHPAKDFEMIANAYRPRAYHNLTHIAYMINMLKIYTTHASKEEVTLLNKHKDSLITAIFMHDFVQDAGKENELQSAQALEEMSKYKGAILQQQVSSMLKTAELIMATRHDTETELSGLEALIADLDLSILGTRFTSVWKSYVEGIRKEYEDVPEKVYNKERIKVLESFLNRPHIYHTPFFRQACEKIARYNLEQELRNLKDSI